MAVITGGIISLLFLSILIFPPLGIILPIYKIKKLKNKDLKYRVIANIVAIAIVGLVDYKFLYVYLAFQVIEIIFNLFKYKFNFIEIFDRIAISSLVTAIFLGIGYYYLLKSSNITVDTIKEIYVSKANIPMEEINKAFTYIFKNIYTIIFSYAYIINLSLYWSIYKNSYLQWKISYLWIAVYVVVFAGNYFSKKDNIYMDNILTIIKIIYITYGIKSLYLSLVRKIKKDFFSKILVVTMLVYIPLVVFVYGAVESLKTEKN
ncbi:MAG: hypothetical protein ACRC0S_04565 [Fusobacteriaceae bacterium]